MTALPSLAVEVTPVMPSTDLRVFSSGSTTCFSTTSGDAPWYGASTDTIGQFDGGQQLLLELRDRDRSEDERDDRDQPDQGPLREAESGQPGHGWVSLLWRTRQVGG